MFGRFIQVTLGRDSNFVPDTSLEFRFIMDPSFKWETQSTDLNRDNTPVKLVPTTTSTGSSIPVSGGGVPLPNSLELPRPCLPLVPEAPRVFKPKMEGRFDGTASKVGIFLVSCEHFLKQWHYQFQTQADVVEFFTECLEGEADKCYVELYQSDAPELQSIKCFFWALSTILVAPT